MEEAEVVEAQVCGTCISGFESRLPPQFRLSSSIGRAADS